MPFVSEEDYGAGKSTDEREKYARRLSGDYFKDGQSTDNGGQRVSVTLPIGVISFARDYNLDLQEEIVVAISKHFKEALETGKINPGTPTTRRLF